MCGIVGILGKHEVAPILVAGLRRLEYRGYDSAGIATVNGTVLDRRRAVGKLVNLSDLLVHDPLAGKSGIGHTRWATHGAPTTGNAHPHRGPRVAVVHNGIVENFRALRTELEAQGADFVTETDTETVALLCQSYLDAGDTPVDAARKTTQRLHGAFALAFLFDGEPDLLVAARPGSPLAVGHGEGEVYLGSDAIALAPLTDKITYLEEGDFAVLRRDSVEIRDAKGNLANRPAHTVQVDQTHVEKGGHKHFMAKEIAEQPAVIDRCLSKYLADGAITLPDGFNFEGVERLTLVACGTAYLACMVAKYWFEQVARLPVEVDIASEFRYREPPVAPGTMAVFVSQSGETADTLAALRYMRDKADHIAAVVNVTTSTIAREADIIFTIHAGTELGVASTKAFTCQLTVLALLALKAAEMRGETVPKNALENLRLVPGLVQHALTLGQRSTDVSRALAEARDIIFLAWRALPAGHGGGAETEGNQLYTCRRLRIWRAKARPHRAHRRQRPGRRHGPARRAFRQNRLEHAGSDGAGRTGLARHR